MAPIYIFIIHGADLPSSCVVGVGSVARICNRPLALLLGSVVAECLAAGMLAIPDGLRVAVGKADHVVFPAGSAWTQKLS